MIISLYYSIPFEELTDARRIQFNFMEVLSMAYRINLHLNKQRPIMVKVRNTASGQEHWVVITGRTYRSPEDVYYTYIETKAPNWTAAMNTTTNRLVAEFFSMEESGFYDYSALGGGVYKVTEIQMNMDYEY